MNPHGIVKIKKLCVFDFDDTLVNSEAIVTVTQESGDKYHLNARKWSDYVPLPGDQFDFRDLEKIRNPKKLEKVWKTFLDRLWSLGHDHVHILSARSSGEPLQKYFEEESIRVQVSWLKIPPGHDNGLYKGAWIEEKLKVHEYTIVEFYDDRHDSCQGVLSLREKYPHIQFHVWRIIEGEMHYVD